MVLSIILLRIFLAFFPDVDLNLAKHEVHHLYTGAFILIILVILFLFGIINRYTIILSGISSALIIDELFFFIFTNGTDAVYFTKIALFSDFLLVVFFSLLTLILYYLKIEDLKIN